MEKKLVNHISENISRSIYFNISFKFKKPTYQSQFQDKNQKYQYRILEQRLRNRGSYKRSSATSPLIRPNGS